MKMTMGTEGATTATTADDQNDANTPEVDESAQALLAAQQEEDAGFAAGYAGVNAPEDGDAGGTSAAADPEPEPEPLFGGFTAAELKEAVEAAKQIQAIQKAQDRLNGTVGSYKQQLDQLRAQPQAKPTALTSENFKKLKADYPELAEMLASDMSELTLGAAQHDPAEIERVVNERTAAALAEADQKNTAKFLSILHPDWKEQLARPEWKVYQESLPADTRQQLNDSWDAFEIGSHIRAFKEAETAAAAKATSKVTKLTKAVMPQGVPVQRGPATMSDEQAMNAGYKAVRGA